MRRMVSSQWLSLLLRLVLGAIFLYAGVVKSQDPSGFAQAIYNYRILPGWAINPLAILLPWVEIVMGAVLLMGLWVPGASLLAFGLLGLFAAALCINLARGLDIDCGCFSTASTGSGSTIWYFLRDMLFMAMAIQVFLFDRQWVPLTRLILRRRN
ncbi:MAG: MauE/DoxX family redox-associated membrane protein [Thermodesulfobacteriota bacterium]